MPPSALPHMASVTVTGQETGKQVLSLASTESKGQLEGRAGPELAVLPLSPEGEWALPWKYAFFFLGWCPGK